MIDGTQIKVARQIRRGEGHNAAFTARHFGISWQISIAGGIVVIRRTSAARKSASSHDEEFFQVIPDRWNVRALNPTGCTAGSLSTTAYVPHQVACQAPLESLRHCKSCSRKAECLI